MQQHLSVVGIDLAKRVFHVVGMSIIHPYGCIGKKGATYATFFWGFTNVWGVSRSWASADRWVAVMLTGSKPGV